MKINFTKISIAILLVIFISTLSFFIIESELNPSTIKDISVLTYSTFTLIIALILFDRFDYRKKIFERKLEATLTLLSEIKSTKIQIFYQDKINYITYGGSPFLLDKKQINIPFLKEHIDFKVKIVFETRNIFEYLQQINLHRANPFMPKEIVKSLDFLSIGHLKGITKDNEYLDKNIKISINNKIQNILNDEEWYKPSTEMEFGTFIFNYINTLDSIENWIDKHSNFKSELNL